MSVPMQIHRTRTQNNPPTGLAPGQLAVEMASNPPRLWVGVPSSIDPSERRELALGGGVDDWSTGDVKLTFKNVADPGWLMCDDGTIGRELSGADHIGNQFENLFKLLFNNIGDGYAPIMSSEGITVSRAGVGSAQIGWDNFFRIRLTRIMGRALAVAGGGAGLTNRPLGMFAGVEATGITVAQLAQHGHPFQNVYSYVEAYTGVYGYVGWGMNVSTTTGVMGADAAHYNWQPVSTVNVMICA